MDSIAPPSAVVLLPTDSPCEIGEKVSKADIGTVHGD